jgi:3-deoxy-D-manno-octulosonate 8-phosphate phosphatase KdsC-like HAD superfamily phosphatase
MKTIICDIDGTLLDYLHDKPFAERKPHSALAGVVEHMRKWEEQGCRIIIITGRRESERVRTVEELQNHGIPYDMLLMGFADTGRVLINDVSKQGICKAHAVSLPRNQGFNEFNWSEVGL